MCMAQATNGMQSETIAFGPFHFKENDKCYGYNIDSVICNPVKLEQ